MALISSGRQIVTDVKFDSDENQTVHSNILFLRASAKEIKFIKVDFKYSIFDNCYLRNCSFDSCDFTGCKFVNSNLPGTHFDGCKFDYCTFDKTFIEREIIDNNAPPYENLKQKFARTLRLNFSSIGDPESANKAILFELKAKGEHLHKAWSSNEGYYRKKYKGRTRASYFLKWIYFWILDFVWGNGESIPKLAKTLALYLIIMAGIDYLFFGGMSFWSSLAAMPGIFLGMQTNALYPSFYVSLNALLRLISIGLFVAIIVKRFNRR